jgi:hypothetical protein
MCLIRPGLRCVAALAAVALLAGCSEGSSVGGRGSGPTSASNTEAPTSPAATTPADNGIAGLPAAEILAKANDAFTRADSVHVKGGGFSEGQQFALDIRYGANGAVGSLTSNGQTIELLRIGSTVYVKGSAAFWRSIGGNPAAELLKGRYLKVPASAPNFAEVASFTDLKKTSEQFLATDAEISKGSRKTIRGMDAIGLNSRASGGGTLYVALRGEPYPLQVAPNNGKTDETGSLDFVDYGVPVKLAPPPADQVVDVSKLGR